VTAAALAERVERLGGDDGVAALEQRARFVGALGLGRPGERARSSTTSDHDACVAYEETKRSRASDDAQAANSSSDAKTRRRISRRADGGARP
jgi:hypothetical protein